MNQTQQKKLQALLDKHLPPAVTASHDALGTNDPEALWEAALCLIEHLLAEIKKLEKDYRSLAIAASESFYSMASQISRQNHPNGFDHETPDTSA